MSLLLKNQTRWFAVLAAGVLTTGLAVLVGCGDDKTSNPNTDDPRFTPDAVSIFVGDTIKWTASDGDHTVTSGTGSSDPASGQLFDDELNEGETFRFVFNNVGIFPYYCTPHEDDDMTGTITVAALSTKTVDIFASGTAFNPPTRTINVGDAVRWTASGSHTITSGINAADPLAGDLFDQALNTSQTFTFTFTTAGTFVYFCRLHGAMGMTGTITVVEPTPKTVEVEATL